MAKRNQEKLTQRQLQSQKIMRQKAAQIRRQQFMQKFRVVAAVVFAALLLLGGFWSWKTNFFPNTIKAISDEVFAVTVRAGYSVQTLYLEGRNRTPLAEVNAALDVDKGAPILRLNLAEIRERLEKIESIKYAAIERALPNTLYVRIVEREPVARWQYREKISLVDDNGVVMSGLDIEPYKGLPLIIGEDAPKHIQGLMEILESEPELAKSFAVAVWVGKRRWNIRLLPKSDSGEPREIEILLPEKDAIKAWKQLAEMQKKEQVLNRDIKVIDLRIEGRLFIKVPESEKPSKPLDAKNI